MSFSPKARKSVPVSEAVTVDTRQVNVAIEGLDCARITSSFRVHLLKDGQRIASRFMFRPAGGTDHIEAVGAAQFAPFDFLLPIDAVADGKLSIEVEPLETSVLGERVPPEQMGHPTMSVYLLLESE
jgi:hypothetical protein